jgi:hypothetical protein
VGALVAVWFVVVAGAWWYVERYEFSVNEPLSHPAVTHWPAESALARSEHRPTLVLFLHPKCPCSRATVNELSRLLAVTTETEMPAPDLIVVATVPPTAKESWWDTGTVAQTERIAGATLFVDRGGREAARFGATTSGFVMLFDESGSCRYAGGITVSRGHAGPSAGGDRLAELLRGAASQASEMPVFGCRLCLPEPEAGTGLADHVPHDETQAESSL